MFKCQKCGFASNYMTQCPNCDPPAPVTARWKPMDIVYADGLHRPRCLILSVHVREDGSGSYEAVSENDGSPILSDSCAMTQEEWLKWLEYFSDDLTGRQMREAREAATGPLVEPESWAGYRKRYAETGYPWITSDHYLKKCPYCQITPVESPHWRGHFGCPTESCAAYAANLTAEEWNTRAENLTLTVEDWLKDRK